MLCCVDRPAGGAGHGVAFIVLNDLMCTALRFALSSGNRHNSGGADNLTVTKTTKVQKR